MPSLPSLGTVFSTSGNSPMFNRCAENPARPSLLPPKAGNDPINSPPPNQRDPFNDALPNPPTMLSAIGGMHPRQLLSQILNFGLVLATAFMLWKALSVASNSPSPIVVVLSGSMEPAFERGDLLFLWNRARDTQLGEIVVYNVRGKDIPIVHRVVRRFGGG